MAAGLAAVLSPSRATAQQAQGHACESSPSSEDIFVPLERVADGVPRQGVLLEAGRTLCLTGEVSGDGEVRRLRLAEGADSPALVEIRCDRGEHGSVVHLRTLLQRRVLVTFLPLEGSIGLALANHEVAVEPGVDRKVYTGARRLLITGIRLSDSAPPPPPAEPLANRDEAPPTFSFAVIAGARALHLDAINRTLQRDGFPALRTNWPAGGMLFELSYARVRVTLGLEGAGTGATAHGSEVRASAFAIRPVLSYEFLRRGPLSLMAGTGPVWGSITLTPWAEGYREFSPRLLASEAEANVMTRWWGWSADVGSEYRLALGKSGRTDLDLRLGFRTAYIVHGGYDGWRTAGPDEDSPTRSIGDAPMVDATGLQWMATVGMGIY